MGVNHINVAASPDLGSSGALRTIIATRKALTAALLASDAAKGVTGQVLGTRMNEIYLFNSPRPIRIVHRADGRTPEAIAQRPVPSRR